MPQGLTSCGSWNWATPGRSDTRLVCKTLASGTQRSSIRLSKGWNVLGRRVERRGDAHRLRIRVSIKDLHRERKSGSTNEAKQRRPRRWEGMPGRELIESCGHF